MLTRFNHLVRASVAVAALLLFDPADAQAAGEGFDVDFCDTACELVVIGAFVLPPLTFLTAELVYAAQWRWFPLGWAIPELIYGALMTSLMVAVASSADATGEAALLVVVPAWLTTHGLLSVVLGDRARSRAVRDGEQPLGKPRIERPQIGFAPLEGGGWVGVRGPL